MDTLSSAADLLREGISRVLHNDPSAYTCLSVAEAVFNSEGDEWNAGIARQWRRFELKPAQR
jgi:hypothetical protein